MSGLMTGTQIKAALLDPNEATKWLEIFEKREFGALPTGKGIGIVGFDEANLGSIAYDLTVGEEVHSLRRGTKIQLSEGHEATLEPGEAALILSRELLCFGPGHAGVTLSKARIMNEGISLSSAKIDPTWYGKLPIPITNISRSSFRVYPGMPICTLLLFELEQQIDPASYLTKGNTPHLGARSLPRDTQHAVLWQPANAEHVSEEHMDEAMAFGPPFDIVRGMFAWNRRSIVDYMEKQWGVKALRELKHSIWEEEFEQIKRYRQEEIGLLKQQIDLLRKQAESIDAAHRADRRFHIGLVVPLIIAVLGWIAVVVKFLEKP